MPAERAPMRKVREVLRLRHALGVSERQIALTTGLSRSTVGEYLRRAAVIGITWPAPEGVDDAELERRLFTPPTFDENPRRPLPGFFRPRTRSRRTRSINSCWSSRKSAMACSSGSRRMPCRINSKSAKLICRDTALDTSQLFLLFDMFVRSRFNALT